MRFPIVFRRAAKAEFYEACEWYESKRLGLSLDFIFEIDYCLSLVSQNPHQYPFIHKDVRKVVVKRFPYCLYFRAENNRVVILAIFHIKRDPEIWRKRT
ncbi:MAG: type II toxin-antitoxin system RelE/ParE family toxin [Nitrospinae bacterium]|nr:type II toxin-antitoxin system RelE/ParE family toxin [Nitrospinota bacterium]